MRQKKKRKRIVKETKRRKAVFFRLSKSLESLKSLWNARNDNGRCLQDQILDSVKDQAQAGLRRAVGCEEDRAGMAESVLPSCMACGALRMHRTSWACPYDLTSKYLGLSCAHRCTSSLASGWQLVQSQLVWSPRSRAAVHQSVLCA